jgi:hypothetical protein
VSNPATQEGALATGFVAFVLLLQLAFAVSLAPVPGQEPSGTVTLTLRLADGRRQFRPGETIPIELEFSSAIPKRFSVDGATYDRSGRLTIDEFTIDRIDEVTDPTLDYFAAAGGSIGGGLRSIGVLGEKPFIVKLELNDWFRFEKTGVYRLSVKSRRVTDETVTPHTVFPVESNTVSFEILARDPDWEASELEAARQAVDAKSALFGARPGCRKMRFLATETAAAEMIRRYGTDPEQGCDFDYIVGLFGVANRAAVVQWMEEGLRTPEHAVTASYLRTLSTLSVYLQHPELRPAQTRTTKGHLVPGGELSKRPELLDAALSAYVEIVNDALPDKTERARAITLTELRVLPSRSLSSAASSRDRLAAVFLDLPAERQLNLLAYEWQSIAGPAMLPVLRRLVNANPSDPPSLPDVALRRLAQLAPAEARSLILREIQRPRRGATLKTLGTLPDAELPDLDDVLAGNFESSKSEISAALVQRYATKKVAPRILASTEPLIGRLACAQQASILVYFLRVDETLGAMLLDRALASRATGCWRALDMIADVRMSPALEARAISDLDNPDPESARAAIRALGRHGSPSAREPLRAAFQRWHVRWNGHADELEYSRALERPNAGQAMVEDEFRQAMGAGQGWLMRATDLRELQALCVTDNCRQQTGYMIHENDTQIILRRIDEPDESGIDLAQYRFTSLVALEAMLVKYPRGTAFSVQRSANETAEVTGAIAELTKFAASQGLSIK